MKKFRTIIITVLILCMLITCMPIVVFSAEEYVDPYLCEHEYEEIYIDYSYMMPNPYCVYPKEYECRLCGDHYKVEGITHDNCIWIMYVTPSFDHDGCEMFFCRNCNKSAGVFPLRYNEYYPRGFTDVNYNAWYGFAVEYCYPMYMKGTAKNTFDPGGVLTREQLAQVLANLAQVDTDEYKNTESGMKDVPVGKWYSGAVAWAVKEGYMIGVGKDEFGLGEVVDRASMVTILYRYAIKRGFGDFNFREYFGSEEMTELSEFTDFSDLPEWAVEAMSWAYDNCIIAGTDEDIPTLSPRMALTRAQCAKMILEYTRFDYNSKVWSIKIKELKEKIS